MLTSFFALLTKFGMCFKWKPIFLSDLPQGFVAAPASDRSRALVEASEATCIIYL